ncbi:PREDICTED: T-cell surface glycoprotein CD3 zeta chain isoform X1 [Ficedula albicollis]|uniref:T-cell surface glycoprotein CD3 zeta chain isoform X1 n=1 Tax=Ficedula albicollis TaxID=59894 RepID=UPI00035A293B|nr:PREDICTED: T-cell surface glycoprotein CD3 zeta chain isoform X1 [Ficedula albicollis]XP_005038914.2 PREDICTED: T-cell surface glycoprotein CD3 zeta chain isoform X1 [Ficedula albicollis]XP_005038915.1 PREDICTED: T-cell surface glycoprotein CD3 zeta chain isoform X1 [Ficedula albicollis]
MTKETPSSSTKKANPSPRAEAVKAEEAGRWTPKALEGGEASSCGGHTPAQPVEELLLIIFFFFFFSAIPSADRPGRMKWRRIAILATLQAQLPATDAASVLGLTDPRLCYVLDGFLFIYAVVMTALFVKAKLSQASEPQLQPGQDDVYNKLSRAPRDDYDVLGGKRGADPELGGRHQQRRKNPQDTVYTSLQKDKMGEAYSEIGMKGEQQRRRGKGHEGLYQGLSAATKDTYDALQMQPLPPR